MVKVYEPLNLEHETLNSLEYFKSCLKHRAQKIVNMRLGWIELDHGDAPLDAKVDAFNSRKSGQDLLQVWRVRRLEIFN